MKLLSLILCWTLPLLCPAQGRSGAILDGMEEILTRRLDQCFHAGLFEECTTILRVMSGMHPGDAQISDDLVYMLGNVDRHGEALAEAIRFHKQNPKSLLGTEQLARYYFMRKLYTKVPPILQAVPVKSRTLNVSLMLGRSLEEIGLLKKSLDVWEARLKLFPSDPSAKRHIERLKKKIAGG